MSNTASLQSLLEKEAAILGELNSLSLLKKDALLNDDLESLETIVLKEEALSGNLKILDNACAPQVQFFLKGQVDPPKEIKGLMDLLRRLVREVKARNDFNQALIKDSLSIIQFTLNAFMGTNEHGPGTYGSSGKPAQNIKNRSMLDCKR